jgi:chaperone modulatory protein CbpM
MSHTSLVMIGAVVVEREVEFTLEQLSHACQADVEDIIVLVDEGVLTSTGDGPQDWRFHGTALLRVRKALRLGRELRLNPAGIALVLDLLDELQRLRFDQRQGRQP